MRGVQTFNRTGNGRNDFNLVKDGDIFEVHVFKPASTYKTNISFFSPQFLSRAFRLTHQQIVYS